MVKKFDLADFKKTIKVTEAVYKKDKYVLLDQALQEVLHLPGLPLGRVTYDYGLSDSGKSTLLFHSVAKCQEQGILPVIILTGPEKKVDWSRARKLGVKYTGDLPLAQQNSDDFIIVEEGLETIEEVFEFINNKIINNVEQGKLPYDTMIFWDSAGNTHCEGAIDKDKNGNIKIKDMHMKAAKVIGEQLITTTPRIESTRKETRPHFVGLYIITSMYKGAPAFPGAPQPWKIKGGNKPKFVSSLMIRHNQKKKLKATKNGEELNFGMISKISVTKNHINGKEYTGEFVITEDSILPNDKTAIDAYKKDKSQEWGKFEVIDESGEVFEGSETRKIGITESKQELNQEE